VPDRPNILLITTDQMRWDTISGRSVCRTPNVNRLAEGGVRFERSYTPVSLCCPARTILAEIEVDLKKIEREIADMLAGVTE